VSETAGRRADRSTDRQGLEHLIVAFGRRKVVLPRPNGLNWSECVSKQKRPTEETPAGLERAIEVIEEAHRGRQHLVALDHRIGGMRGNIAEFNSRVAAVICAVAPDLNGQPAETAARELRHRLDTNRKIETRRDQLLDQQKQAQAKCTKAEIAQRQAEAARESLRDEIGGGSDDEILSRLQQAFERARAELKVRAGV